MKKLIVAISFLFVSNLSWSQTKEAVRVEFNSISTNGEVVDEELFRNDSLVILHNPGKKLAIFSFELNADQPGIPSPGVIKGNRITLAAKEQLKALISSGQRIIRISNIKLINTTTNAIEEYPQELTIKIVFN